MLLSKLLDIAVKNTLKQYFSPEENDVLISYMLIEKSQFLIEAFTTCHLVHEFSPKHAKMAAFVTFDQTTSEAKIRTRTDLKMVGTSFES